VEFESKSDTDNNRGDWNHFTISNIPGKLEIKGLQKTAMLGTADKLRKALM
jgi:hypothetical protein